MLNCELLLKETQMLNDRKNKPQSKSEIEFRLPNSTEFYLESGLRVIYVLKENLPMIRLNLMINGGSKFDPEGKNGLSYLTALVLDEGADGMDALQLSDGFDLLGANFSLSADNDLINISLQTLSDKFESSLELFSKILLKPEFNKGDFEREKHKLVTRILQSMDEPEYLADQIFDRIILGKDNSYSSPVSGYQKTVQSIDIEEIKACYKRLFSPSNSTIIVVGNIQQEQLEKQLNKYLSGWIDIKDKTSISTSTAEQKKKIYLYHKLGSVQAEIRVGHNSVKRNQKDYFPRLLLNTILGGQFTSRINLNLRERNGFTYGATSRFQYFKDVAFFEVSTSVGINNTVKALKEILFELENIKNGITDTELYFAKSSITKKFPLNFETYRQISTGIASKILFDLPDDYFQNYILNVNSVSQLQVNQAAKDFILSDKLSIVLIGDKNILLPKLKELSIEIAEVNFYGEII